MRKGIVIIVLVLLTVSTLSYGLGGWVIEEIETFQEDYYGATSLVLDSNDNPYVAYSVNGSVKYAYKNGVNWQLETVANGGSPSLAFDSSENPCISYAYSDNICYTAWNGSSWESEIVSEGYIPSLQLDYSNDPHIVYSNGYNGELIYSLKSGATWYFDTVNEDCYYDGISLTLSPGGLPHISYLTDGHTASYSYWDGYEWGFAEFSGPGMLEGGTAIALEGEYYPHIIYGGHTLEYARWNGSYWTETTINPEASDSVSITLDSSLYPHISFYGYFFKGKDYDTGLRYIYWNGSAWEIDDIDMSDYQTYITNTSIQLDSEGYPHIAYFRSQDSVDSSVRYTYWDPYLDVEEETPTTPTTFSLSPAYPNPSSGSATIAFALPRSCAVNLEVFDIKGRKVTTLAEGTLAPGEYEREVSGLSSGVYLYRLTAGDFAETKKMVVR